MPLVTERFVVNARASIIRLARAMPGDTEGIGLSRGSQLKLLEIKEILKPHSTPGTPTLHSEMDRGTSETLRKE